MVRFEIVLGLLFSSSFVSQPLRKGMVRFEIAVVVFFSSSSLGSQPLRKGMWRFEIAVCFFLPFLLGHNP